MGTNYYLAGERCEHCGQEMPDAPRKHIGKSSAGWVFALHVIPEEGINDLADWVKLWDREGARIVDEYGRLVTPYEMLKCITLRGRASHQNDRDFNHAANGSEPGPNGLVRARIGRHCQGHGAGTWSLHTGEFS